MKKTEEQTNDLTMILGSNGLLADPKSNGNQVYAPSIREYRKESTKRLSETRRGYEALRNKESSYARAIKKILDLNEAVAKIYEEAPDLI